MKTIITTVGTSIFSNFTHKEVTHAYGQTNPHLKVPHEKIFTMEQLDEYSNDLAEDYEDDFNKKLEEAIKKYWLSGTEKTGNKYWKEWNNAPNLKNIHASAEISSICKIVEQDHRINRKSVFNYEIFLLTSDTAASMSAAYLVKAFFEGYELDVNGKNVVYPPLLLTKKFTTKKKTGELIEIEKKIQLTIHTPIAIEGLRIDDAEGFRKRGVLNLFEKITKAAREEHTILNISGGYKAIVPIMTLIGQIKGYDLNYIYEEDESQLIEIGNMPIHFDWNVLESYVSMLHDTSKITGKKITELEQLGIILPPTSIEGEAVSDSESIQLSIIGELLKKHLENGDVPFQKDAMGYFVEYKIYEHYNNNPYEDFLSISVGYKLSEEIDNDLEDADLWMERCRNGKREVVMAEVKPASFSLKDLRKKIRKLIQLTSNIEVDIKEFWLIIYDYKDHEINNNTDWCENLLNESLTEVLENVLFKVKKFTIPKNEIDGNRNRMKYHEFMRSDLPVIETIFTSN